MHEEGSLVLGRWSRGKYMRKHAEMGTPFQVSDTGSCIYSCYVVNINCSGGYFDFGVACSSELCIK